MITHPEIGKRLMEEVIEKVGDIGKLKSPPKMEGKQLIAYFVADKSKLPVKPVKTDEEIRQEKKKDNPSKSRQTSDSDEDILK